MKGAVVEEVNGCGKGEWMLRMFAVRVWVCRYVYLGVEATVLSLVDFAWWIRVVRTNYSSKL